VLQKYYINAQRDNKMVMIFYDKEDVFSLNAAYSLNYGLQLLNLQFKYI